MSASGFASQSPSTTARYSASAPSLELESTPLQHALYWLWQSLVVSGLQPLLSAQHVLLCGGWSTVRVWCVVVLLLLLKSPCAAPGILNKWFL